MKAAIYTLIAYFVVVLALVLPYFFIGDAVTAFVFTVGIGLLVVVYYAGFASVIHEKSLGHFSADAFSRIWSFSNFLWHRRTGTTCVWYLCLNSYCVVLHYQLFK